MFEGIIEVLKFIGMCILIAIAAVVVITFCVFLLVPDVML